MASAAKRVRREPGPGALAAFLEWCGDAGLVLSPKVCVSREGTVTDYGLIAREDLQAGEVLFTVPRNALLSQHTSSLSSLLEKEQASLESQSGWVPLLIALLHESTISNSYWGPYFSLWHDFSGLDHPMFWSEEERRRLLQGTGVSEAVDKDLANIQTEYSSVILPFLKAHPEIFNPKVHTLELYKKLVAFVMAYSFQEPLEEDAEDEPNPPVMVPVADLLNHVANHNANLEYSPECLKMVVVQPIRKGQEVFNTYGEMASWQLLHMYGFAEPYPGNRDDAADIQMLTLYKAALQVTKTDAEKQLVLDQWDLLCQMEMVGEEGAFVIGWEKVLTGEELSMALKVLGMSAEEFKEFKEQEDWADKMGENGNTDLTLSMIPTFKASWKKLLFDATLLTLQAYSSDLKAEEEMLSDQQAFSKLSCRERFALQVRYGQKKILHQLLELVSS
uniref:N-lysine methyltransferase SETD6 n=1 Tax=Euleptes europaea TaxID=460621 RepID=UPI0025406B45|nr:N-lysine methyltransferase SETD6 [Euleptes europaea]